MCNARVTAKIEWIDTQRRAKVLLPAFLLNNRELAKFGVELSTSPGQTKEDSGHIIPQLLGGSEHEKMKNPQDNFFSQNRTVNRGAYKVFADKVNSRLQEYHNGYEAERTARQNERNSRTCFCICNPLAKHPQDPDKPFLVYDVELIYPNQPSNTLESNFTKRPIRLTVKVRFELNSYLAYTAFYRTTPHSTLSTVVFTNNIDFTPLRNRQTDRFQGRNNYYEFISNGANIQTTSVVRERRAIPIDARRGF